MFYIVDELSKRVLDDAVNRILSIRGGPGILVHNSPSGITITAIPPKIAPLVSTTARLYVLVKWNAGSDGDESTYATWTYDLYALSDSSLATKLNAAGALQPKCGRCRSLMSQVTKADDGSVASAYFDENGAIQLFDCAELYVQSACDEEASLEDWT